MLCILILSSRFDRCCSSKSISCYWWVFVLPLHELYIIHWLIDICLPSPLYTAKLLFSHRLDAVTRQWQCSHCWQLPAAWGLLCQWSPCCWQLPTVTTLSLSSYHVVTVSSRWLMESEFCCVHFGHVHKQEFANVLMGEVFKVLFMSWKIFVLVCHHRSAERQLTYV